MKKLFTFLFFVFLCSYSFADNFKEYYDDVLDMTTICHKDMEVGYMYNLKNGITNERENVRLFISDNCLVFEALFNNPRYAFINKIVFLGSSRLVIENGQRNDGLHNGLAEIVEETYRKIMDDEEINRFYDFLKNNEKITVSFVGQKFVSSKLKLNPKHKKAMIETIEKYRELKNK